MMTLTAHCPGGYEDEDEMDISDGNAPRPTGSVNMLAEVCHVGEEIIRTPLSIYIPTGEERDI